MKRWFGLLLAPALLSSWAAPTGAGTLQPGLERLLVEPAPGMEGLSASAVPGPDSASLPAQLLVSTEAAHGPGRVALERSLAELGIVIRGTPWESEPRVWEVEVPPSSLARAATLEGVVHVGSRLEPLVPPGRAGRESDGNGQVAQPGRTLGPALAGAFVTGEVESEALEEMRVPEAHALGYRGRGVRIGIVDVGFDGYLERVGTELPPDVTYRSFTDRPSTQSHGTACAEVISDVAPDAELFLAEIGSSLELQEALDWFIENDVEVMSHSLAWFLGGGDGTGPIADMTEEAAREGVQWITSSGNFRRSHWNGSASDEDEDGWIDTGAARNDAVRIESGSGSISLILSWDRWPLSESVSFQIDVYEGGVLHGTSETDYGNDYPFAFRQITVPSANWLAPEFRIRSDRGNPDGIRLRVFRVDGGFLHPDDRIEAGSLAIPADSPWALSVGAYSYRGTNLEPFSSYGPTGAGLTKPELIGADAVSTSLSRYPRFVGTSAACPHAAGAVAVLLSAGIEGGAFDLHWSREEILDLLQSAAEPFGNVAEVEQGWGRLRIPLAPQSVAASPLTVLRSADDVVVLRLRGVPRAEADPIGIFDVSGRRLASIAPSAGAGGISSGPGTAGVDYEISPETVRLRTGRYWARDFQTGATAPFLWIR